MKKEDLSTLENHKSYVLSFSTKTFVHTYLSEITVFLACKSHIYCQRGSRYFLELLTQFYESGSWLNVSDLQTESRNVLGNSLHTGGLWDDAHAYLMLCVKMKTVQRYKSL